MLADCSALKAADLKADTTLAPLFKTFNTHVAAMHLQLRSDNLNEDAAVLNDESVIDTELVKIIDDKATDKAALPGDRKTLLADRIQLQNDEIAGLNSRLATRQTDYTKLFNDLTAITSALSTDTGASPALATAVTKFDSDRTTILNTLSGDLKTLIADRTQLVKDLTALENQD